MERMAGWAGLLGASVFLLALLALHAASPGVDWIRHHYVSDFATGPLGVLFVVAVVMHGAGNLALGAGLFSATRPASARTVAAVVLFETAAVGIVVAGLFPVDVTGAPRTVAGLAHRAVVAVSFPAELAAISLFSSAFAQHPYWRQASGPSLALSSTGAFGLAVFLLAVFLDRWPALAERLTLAAFLAWELWVAFQLTRLPDTSAQVVMTPRTP